MPYKFIGRTLDTKGKSLWEILGNLKDCGVGRIVARNIFERYPEPSYVKIVKVETLAEPPKSFDEWRKVKVWVEKTFRGRKYPQVVTMMSSTYKTDYKLIPKDEEESYCKFEGSVIDTKIVPRSAAFPPLMREIIVREMKARGESVTKEPELELVYQQGRDNVYKIAKENETPTVEIVPDLGTPLAPRLYEGLKL